MRKSPTLSRSRDVLATKATLLIHGMCSPPKKQPKAIPSLRWRSISLKTAVGIPRSVEKLRHALSADVVIPVHLPDLRIQTECSTWMDTCGQSLTTTTPPYSTMGILINGTFNCSEKPQVRILAVSRPA